MDNNEIFNNLFQELKFIINNLEKEQKSVYDTDIKISKGYKMAIKDFKDAIETLEKRKNIYLNN